MIDKKAIPTTLPVFDKVIEQIETDQEIDVNALEVIYAIERQQDAFINFCRKINDGFQNLAGVSIHKLRQVLPELLPFILKDAFFTVNAVYRVAPWKSNITGLDYPWSRAEKWLRYLNACYCDIDFYKTGLDWPKALEIITRAQEEERIPPASIIGRSGRGMYLLWLLRSGREGAQQRAFAPEIELYKQINKASYKRINEIDSRLNADPIFDASRILRLPGSINTKSDSQVIFQIQLTRRGVPVYALKELAGFYRIPSSAVEIKKLTQYNREIKNPGSCPARRRGKIATAIYRMNDILTIYQHIGGFKQGRRRRSLTVFCYVEKTAGKTLSEILQDTKELAKGCVPPYPSDSDDIPVEKLVNTIWLDSPRFYYNYKLAKFFGVTPELAEELDLRSIVPKETARKRKRQPSDRETAQRERRAFLRRYFKNKPGRRPSVRKMRSILESNGMNACVQTVATDINAVMAEKKAVMKEQKTRWKFASVL